MKILAWACLVVVLAASSPGGAVADDDLDVVKRAVAKKASSQTEPSAEARPTRSQEPRWLKVRVVDKESGKQKVSIILPLGLVEIAGDWPLDGCPEWRRWQRQARLSIREALAALKSGRDLVQIDDQDTSVRVWVE